MQNAIVPTTQRVVHIVTLLVSSNAKDKTLRTYFVSDGAY